MRPSLLPLVGRPRALLAALITLCLCACAPATSPIADGSPPDARSPTDAGSPADAPSLTDALTDAALVRTPVPVESPDCGAFEQPCCLDGPACEPGLACTLSASSTAPARCLAARTPRCIAEGIADPTHGTASFERAATRGCTSVPEALRNAITPGTYAPGSPRIGYLACSGLTPGRATLRLRACVRMIEQDCLPAAPCCCGSPATYRLGVQLYPGPMFSLEGRQPDVDQWSCTDGPDIDWTQPVTVPPDGRLSARIDLAHCDRNRDTNCLFLRGSSLEVLAP